MPQTSSPLPHPPRAGGKKIDLTGQHFGRLVVIEEAGRDKIGRVLWRCQCECPRSNICVISGGDLRSGHSASCGCLRREVAGSRLRTHGKTGTKAYRAWTHMLSRCRDHNCNEFPRWGGIGITVCERWLRFENFLADMGEPPSPKHSIDRWPDKAGNYQPGNVRWATIKEQNRNRRDNRMLSLFGQNWCITEWSEELGINDNMVHWRLQAGWPPEYALLVPRGEADRWAFALKPSTGGNGIGGT
jgi:hypothetical protein